MLQGLDAIDWGSLHHAYGAATDVPGLLRALASPSRKQRSSALYELCGNIWHQGTVYEATGFAVPFLIELLQEPAVKGKAEILGLLQAISYGSSYLEAHQGMEWYRHERRTPAFQEQLREELFWVRKAVEAVSAGVPVYLRLLVGPSVKLRIWSAYVLTNCTDRFREGAPALQRRLSRERHPLARASLVWAWVSLCRTAHKQGLAGRQSEATMKKRLRAILRARDERAVVRLIAGLGLMQFLPEQEHTGFARFFAAALARCPRGLARLPWTEGVPMHFVCRSLAHQRGLVLNLVTSIVQAPDHPCRERAIYELTQICLWQPPARTTVAPLLVTLLDSANVKVRRESARLLSNLGSAAQVAREALVKALEDSDRDVALSAAVALSKMGDSRAVPYLKRCLARGNASSQVLDAIKRLGQAAKETIPHLRKLLKRGSGNTRILAALALGLMGEASTDAVGQVADLLWDASDGAGAGWALMQWGPLAREAVPRIVKFLQSKKGEPLARTNAIKALGSMGPHARPALGVLERLLREPPPQTQVTVAIALWQITPRAEHVIPVVLEILGNAKGKRPEEYLCASALEALESFGPAARSAAPLVRELLDDPYQWTRVRAARALWRMGEPVEVFLPLLIAELRCRPVGLLAAECLAEIGPPAAAAVPRLQEILISERSVSEGGTVDEIVEGEEEFRRAVAKALDSIQRSP